MLLLYTVYKKTRVKYQRLKYGPYDRFNSLPFPHFFDLHTPFGLTGLPLIRSAVINIMDHMAYVPIGTYKALVQVIQKKQNNGVTTKNKLNKKQISSYDVISDIAGSLVPR